MQILEQLPITSWEGPFPQQAAQHATAALEEGKILYAPDLHFDLTEAEQRFLSPSYLDPKSKNLSFNPATSALGGTHCEGTDRQELTAMLRRFCTESERLILGLCPGYRDHLTLGFTSFRPAEIAGRVTSWRKDDTRLHVDAFPSRPMQGKRIMRVFANVNPEKPRIWRAGEPFEDMAKQFIGDIQGPLPGSAWLLKTLKVVKGRRAPYDHYMLALHDRMKADERYQSQAPQAEISFPPGSVWACYTDSVSHAAMSGQFAFEQTFYLPVNAMQDPRRAPVRILERIASRSMV